MSFLAASCLVTSSHCPPHSANHHPTIWGDRFIHYASESLEATNKMEEEIKKLIEEVKKMLVPPTKNHIEKMHLIDLSQRLGVNYHFELEIDDLLQQIHNHYVENEAISLEKDLHTLALLFRLLRQQRYSISPDVFAKFRDENGDFKMSLVDEEEGMLSLYEAANLGINGEDILEQALAFTTTYLYSRLSGLKSEVKEKVIHALNCPIRTNLERLDARFHISMYSREDSRIEPLLNLAVLEFNCAQAKQKEELHHVTKWSQKWDFVTKVPYARDRVVEAYTLAVGVYFDPQYSIGRIILCKLVVVVTLIDDTYDAYATLQQLQLFTQAFHRWDIRLLGSIPECMKVVFEAVLELYQEMELAARELGTSCFLPYVKKAIQDLTKSFLVEAMWFNEGSIPSYEEYIVNGIVSSTYPMLQTACFLCLPSNFANKEVSDWISKSNGIPKIVKASSLVARLTNDLTSSEKKGHDASAVEYCKKQYGIAEEEAFEVLRKELRNAWKDINGECLRASGIPKLVLDCVVNFTRLIEVVYANFEDRYTHGYLLRHHISQLLEDPLHIH